MNNGSVTDLPSSIARGDTEPPSELLAALGDPPAHAQSPDPDRVAGTLLALAIGDALGNASESKLPHERRAQHGEIRDYLPNRRADGRRVGLPSDDRSSPSGRSSTSSSTTASSPTASPRSSPTAATSTASAAPCGRS